MKRTCYGIAIFVAVLIMALSAHPGRVAHAAEGSQAPQFTLITPTDTVQLSALRGKQVLMVFWDSCDPASRIAAAEAASRLRSSDNNHQFQLLSICMDDNEELFQAICRTDRLDQGTQLRLGRQRATEMLAEYHPELGNRSFLIDPQGKIVEIREE